MRSRPTLFRPVALALLLTLAALLFVASCSPTPTPGPGTTPSAEPTTPAPEPTTPAPEPTTPVPEPVAEVHLSFAASLDDGAESELVDAQLARFTEETGIMVDLIALPPAELENRLAVMAAAGNLPDVIAVGHDTALRFFREGLVAALEPQGLDEHLAAAQKAVQDQASGETFALPWRRYLCVPQFIVTSVSPTTAYPDEAPLLAGFFAQPQQQEEAFKTLFPPHPFWYPTHAEANAGVAGCADEPFVVRPVTPEERETIVGDIQERVEELRTTLIDKQLWPESQPTEYAYELATGILAESDGEPAVLLGAVPVQASQEFTDFFLESNLEKYVGLYEGQAGLPGHRLGKALAAPGYWQVADHVVVGAVVVNDPAILQAEEGTVDPGSYAAVWGATPAGDGAAPAETFALVGETGDTLYTGTVETLNGDEVDLPPDDPTGQELQPVVTVEEGSWRICWRFDRRRACIGKF